jgi:hypothetical protein
VQSNHIISTVKHFALNAQETGRMIADRIDWPRFTKAICWPSTSPSRGQARLGDVRLQSGQHRPCLRKP